MRRRFVVTIDSDRDYDDQFAMKLMEKIAATAKGKSDRRVTVENGDIVILAKEKK